MTIKYETLLYNTKHPLFKNSKNTKRLRAQITHLVNLFNTSPNKLTPEDCAKKWHSLRTNYSAEQKKIRESTGTGTGTANVYKPSMKFFDEMAFVKDFLEVRRSVDNSGEEDIIAAIIQEEEVCF
ncbi:uncharacterized protein [Bemisia tabaci]|uniref:uncharacterized protein n=1 Tax=Bemisia tabaci TaxID=7038 RepID=UPI003B2874C1